MKILHCSDAGFDCKAVVRANTEEEVLKKAAEHAQTVHGVTLTPEMAAQIKTLIKEEEERIRAWD
jgi:predicted small metal-binding protein